MDQSVRITVSALVVAASLLSGVHDRVNAPAGAGQQSGRVPGLGAEPAVAEPADGAVIEAVAGDGYDIGAAGFAPTAEVDLELTNSHWQGSTRADASGRVAVRFVVPGDLTPGSYVLSLTGRRGAAPDALDGLGRAGGDAAAGIATSGLRLYSVQIVVG